MKALFSPRWIMVFNFLPVVNVCIITGIQYNLLYQVYLLQEYLQNFYKSLLKGDLSAKLIDSDEETLGSNEMYECVVMYVYVKGKNTKRVAFRQ